MVAKRPHLTSQWRLRQRGQYLVVGPAQFWSVLRKISKVIAFSAHMHTVPDHPQGVGAKHVGICGDNCTQRRPGDRGRRRCARRDRGALFVSAATVKTHVSARPGPHFVSKRPEIRLSRNPTEGGFRGRLQRVFGPNYSVSEQPSALSRQSSPSGSDTPNPPNLERRRRPGHKPQPWCPASGPNLGAGRAHVRAGLLSFSTGPGRHRNPVRHFAAAGNGRFWHKVDVRFCGQP
jgi:hypothetical protein